MKVRYPHKCPYCHVMLVIGHQAVKFRGLQWHRACVEAYKTGREQRQSGSGAA